MREKALKGLEAAQSAAPAGGETRQDGSTAPGTGEGAQPAVQTDAETVTQDNPKADAVQQPGAETTDPGGEDFDLARIGPLPPAELQAKLKAKPELASILEADPELKNSLFAASRLSQKAALYDGVFPGGVEEAKLAAEGNQTFSNLANLFGAVKDKQTTQQVMSEMMKLSYVLDDEGKPVLDKNGRPKSDGTVGKFIEQTFGLGLDHWSDVAKQKGDDELAAAIDVLKARAFNTRSASASEELTEEQRQRQESLDRQQQVVAEEQRKIDDEKRQSFEQKADTAYYAHMDKTVDAILAKAALSDEDKARVRQEIKDEVDGLIGSNSQFLAAQRLIWNRQGYGPKKLDDLTALGSRWINEVLPQVARAKLTKAGSKFVDAQTDRNARLDARAQASRSEPTAAMRHAAPAEMTTAQLHQKAREDFQAKNGRAPTDREILHAVRELRSGGVRTTAA